MKIFLTSMLFTTFVSLAVYAQIQGNALYFDGIDDYVDLGNPTTFNVGNALTYEAWIKPDSLTSGFIIAKWVAFAEDIQLGISGNKIFFYLHNVFNGIQLYSSKLVLPNKFNHIAATYDASSGLAKIIINGLFDTSKNVLSGVSNSNGNLYFGFNPSRGDFVAPYKGIIDEVRIWNIVRTESEIQSTMNQSLIGNETGLVGYWNFEEGTGTTTSDLTNNNNDGTISGAKWVTVITSLKDENDYLKPDQFYLEQNFPNPFNPSTKISWQSPVSGHQSLKVYDVLGNEVATLLDEHKEAGKFEMDFNASQLASGIYFYKLSVGEFTSTKKMILIK